MSQAFVRENDDQWLNEIPPTMNSLVNFLTRENNGVRVYEQKNYPDAHRRLVHVMSNGMSYATNSNGSWEIV